MRVEQLYPLSIDELVGSLDGFKKGGELLWVQEEPTNMGAWPYIKLNFSDTLSRQYKLHRVSRVRIGQPQHRKHGRAQAGAGGN